MNFDTYRPFIAKIVAPLIGALVTLLNKKYGYQFSDADVQQAIGPVVDLIIFAISTGVSAVTINKKVNPGNAASSHLAGAEKEESDTIKKETSEMKTP